MGKTIIALATGDIHYHDWKSFNSTQERTHVSNQFLFHIFNEADALDVPIFHTGDLFHTPKGLTTKTLTMFVHQMRLLAKEFPHVRMMGISGNHDLDRGDSLWQAACEAFPGTLINVDNCRYDFMYYSIIGIPYIKRNIELVNFINQLSEIKDSKILLLHTELYGAPDPSGYQLEPQNLPRNLHALFKDFKLVLAGHVHKYTQVEKNVHMVGAPYQQRKSDAGCQMGYLQIYDDYSVEFIPYEAPEFRFFQEGTEHEDTNDWWVEIPEPRKLKKKSEAEFSPRMDKEEMAIRYAKETGVKSPRKIKALIDILRQTDD